MSSYPAGWYPDYAVAGQLRYWDGEQWTGYVHATDGDANSRRGLGRRSKFRPSPQLVEATYRMLWADRSMVGVLAVGAVVAAAVGGAILFPAMYWGHITPAWSGGGFLGVVTAGASLGAASAVLELVCGAVVAAATLRADGRSATVAESLQIAWSRRRQLLAWAVAATAVGAVIRMLERLGVGGVLAAVTLNLGWAAATIFATPVIIVEGTMPAATARRSAALVRQQFGLTMASSLRLALPWTVMGIGAMAAAVAGGLTITLTSGATGTLVGAVLLIVGAVAFWFVAAVSTALTAYLETYLYRYVLGLPLHGIDRRMLPPLPPT